MELNWLRFALMHMAIWLYSTLLSVIPLISSVSKNQPCDHIFPHPNREFVDEFIFALIYLITFTLAYFTTLITPCFSLLLYYWTVTYQKTITPLFDARLSTRCPSIRPKTNPTSNTNSTSAELIGRKLTSYTLYFYNRQFLSINKESIESIYFFSLS